MRAAVRRAAWRLTGNERGQRLLEWTASKAQALMGIGSGTSPESSGEAGIFPLLLRRRQPPYCVFDVGANRGQFLAMARAQFAGRPVRFHAFEPGRATFEMLCSTSEGPDATLNNAALGREAGPLTLYADEPGSGMASLTRRRLGHFGIAIAHEEQVAVTTLDAYCAARGIDGIDLLKLDVEGHELDVLAGGRSMFERGAVAMVSFEFGGCNIDTRTFLQDFFYFFREHGMTIHRITPSGYLRPLPAYREIDEQFRTSNFVAIGGERRR